MIDFLKKRPFDITNNMDGTLTYSAKCLVTDKPYSVTVRIEGIAAWLNGEFIQKALFDVSAADREFLMSQTSPEDFDILYPSLND